MAQWRTVPSCRIYRDQSGPARQTGGAVLQPAGHGGAVDQGREERAQLDPPVLSRLCGQPGAAATVRAGLQPGQLSAAGGAAASGASLDVNNAAGETDQDRGEGRAPFPAGCLPDGRGGGPARVVPDYFGTDWAAEIAHSLIRMNEKVKGTHENEGNHGRGVFKWHEKVCGKAQLSTNRSLCQRKTEFGPEKKTCQPLEQAENDKNHQKSPRWSWATNQMGNPS